MTVFGGTRVEWRRDYIMLIQSTSHEWRAEQLQLVTGQYIERGLFSVCVRCELWAAMLSTVCNRHWNHSIRIFGKPWPSLLSRHSGHGWSATETKTLWETPLTKRPWISRFISAYLHSPLSTVPNSLYFELLLLYTCFNIFCYLIRFSLYHRLWMTF